MTEEIKIILLGNTGVGKTSLINVCIDPYYALDLDNNNPTLASYFVQKNIICNTKKYILDIWDTAGQEAYLGVTKLFFKGSDIIIFVYDICSENTFKDLGNWINMTEEIIDNPHVCGIVGNKNDLYLNAKISEEDAKKFADSKNFKFKLVSAKNDPRGFSDFLVELVKEYTQKFQKPEKKRSKSIKLKNSNSDKDNNNDKGHNCC